MKKKVISIVTVFLFLIGLFLIALEESRQEEQIPAAKELVLEAFAPEQKEDAAYVYFGSIRIEKLKDWKVEYRVADDGAKQCVFVDAHSESEDLQIRKHDEWYEHEIVITPYRVKDMPEEQQVLVAGLMRMYRFRKMKSFMSEEMLPAEHTWLAKAYDEESETDYYFLLSNTETGEPELYVISESSLVAYGNELEAFYEDFVEQDIIRLDGGETQLSLGEVTDTYFFLKQKDREPLLVKVEKAEHVSKIIAYGAPCYDERLSIFYARECVNANIVKQVDINGDGYEDFLKDEYIKNKYKNNNEEIDDFVGLLWSPAKNEFVYLGREELLSSYRHILQEPEVIYTENDKLPEDLISAVSKALTEGRETIYQLMSGMVCSREISDEELQALSRESIAVKNRVLGIAACNGLGCWVMADVDNDGTEDLFLQKYLGGTMGINYYSFLKGTEEGDFCKEEEVGSSGFEEFAFIRWNGVNYLSQTTVDYDKKVYDGIKLSLFRDGQVCDTVWVRLIRNEDNNAHRVEEVFCAEEINCDSIKKTMWEFEYDNTCWMQPSGTAEISVAEQKEFLRQSDIDNDGVLDRYDKSVWAPSNYYTRRQLELSMEDENLFKRIWTALEEEEGIPVLMWVDATEQGNITYILYEDSLYDFHISAYRFDKESYQKLSQVNHTYELEIELHRDVDLDSFGKG